MTLGRINCDWLAVSFAPGAPGSADFPSASGHNLLHDVSSFSHASFAGRLDWRFDLFPVVAQTVFSVLPTRQLAGLVVRHLGTSGGLPTFRRIGGPLRHFAGEQRRSVNERSFINQ